MAVLLLHPVVMPSAFGRQTYFFMTNEALPDRTARNAQPGVKGAQSKFVHDRKELCTT